jgi:hypothetical protein
MNSENLTERQKQSNLKTYQTMLAGRIFPGAEVKLLRLDILPETDSFSCCVSCVWLPAQPGEDLSPEKASEEIKMSPWAGSLALTQMLNKLYLRFPPEQFPLKYVKILPAFKLLNNAMARTNWFWKSGFIPASLSQTGEHTTRSQVQFLIDNF